MTSPIRSRFWYPHGEDIRVLDGFLPDPHGGLTQYINPNLVQLSDLRETSCLVLLGEPGSGKSTCLEAECTSLKENGESYSYIDLGEFGSDESIARCVFGDPIWDRWQAGEILTIFLDSYDECRVSLPCVGQVLLRELRRLKNRDRLRLRIACRAGVWPALMDNGLNELWPDQSASYELAPLQREDAIAIARNMGVEDGERFLDDITDADALPLATVPLTLQMLVGAYQHTHGLPARRSELYERGCLSLCTEHSPSRRAADHIGSYSPDQRLAVAARLAALTILCGRSSIWLGPEDQRQLDDDCLTVSEACGGVESANGVDFEITNEAIREVLHDTALFSAQDTERLTWVHRSYAEYLAARFLLSHDVPKEQIRSILGHPSAKGRMVPQLRGVAAWMGVRKDVLAFICECDPQVLFEVDVAEQDESDRAAIVETVLAAARDTQLTNFDLSQRHYRRLAHDRLAEQLAPIISDRLRNQQERRIAMSLAWVCCLSDIEEVFLSVAEDREDELHLRAFAAAALAQSTNIAFRRQVGHLLDGDLSEDVDDELRGCALRAVWPGLISAVEILPHLTPLKRDNLIGDYWRFVDRDFVDGLLDEDLSVALEWVTSLPRNQLRQRPFSMLCERLLVKAWQASDRPGLALALGVAFWQKIRSHEGWSFDEEIRNDCQRLANRAELRHRLLAALLLAPPTLSEGQRCVHYIGALEMRLIRQEDLPWLIEQLDSSPAAEARRTLADLVASLFSVQHTSDYGSILDASERHSELRDALAHMVDPVPLDSERAERLRRLHREHFDWENRREDSPTLDPPPRNRILRSLDRVESGHVDAWVYLTYELTLTPTSTRYGPTWASDLTQEPGWKEADGGTRSRILSAAERFLRGSSPDAEDWFDEPNRSMGDRALAGFKALRLVRNIAPDRFETIEASIWETWTPALLTGSGTSERETRRARQELASVAYGKRPDQFISWLRRRLACENARVIVSQPVSADGSHGEERREECPTDIVSRLALCWCQRIAETVRSFAWASDTNGTIFRNLLDGLIQHGDQGTIDRALALLHGPLPTDPGERQRCRSAAISLLRFAPDAALTALVRLEGTHLEFCREVILGLCGEVPLAAAVEVARQLSEDQVADLYLLLTRLFPPSDMAQDGASVLSGPEVVADMQATLPQNLASRGSPAAVAAIDRMLAARPEDTALKFKRLDAERASLQRGWEPPAPAQLLALVWNREKRLVRSGEELLFVLRESTDRYEEELQGETPQNFTLWDGHRPKEENRFSDALRRHYERDLSRRGIITNREVEIRPGQGDATGERTDIQVDAIHKRHGAETTERIRAIVEVKGCWHREVRTAMETQLRDRYLRDNDCRHGLYVVGWFLCPQWDTEDYRLSDATRQMPSTIDEARQHFADQATAASVDDMVLASCVVDCALR